MRAGIVKIGNSQGIRIPKLFLEQTGIVDNVELEVANNKIIIRPISNPRKTWDDAFRNMAEEGDDSLVIGEDSIEHSWDEEEWAW